MFAVIGWIFFGLIVGLIARLLYPGKQSMGIFMTMVLGIIGSLVGGAISYALGYDPQDGLFQGAGWIMSIVGAMIVVWSGLFLGKDKTVTRV